MAHCNTVLNQMVNILSRHEFESLVKAVIGVYKQRPGRKAPGIRKDCTVHLGDIEKPLRLIDYADPETGNAYSFITNAFHIPAKTVADLYKERWQIEHFFKWIKQNLKIKTFLGTSNNAVLTQIRIALCVYLMLAYMKFTAKLGITMRQMLRLLQLNLFERRKLIALFKPPDPLPVLSDQLTLWIHL